MEKKKNRTRNIQVMCRLNEEEYSKYKILLEKSGLSSQDFIRKNITTTRFTVVQKVSNDKVNEDLGNALFQLQKIGTNINQIAKRLNCLDYQLPQNFKNDYIELLAEMKELIKSIGKEIEKNDSETRCE